MVAAEDEVFFWFIDGAVGIYRRATDWKPHVFDRRSRTMIATAADIHSAPCWMPNMKRPCVSPSILLT